MSPLADEIAAFKAMHAKLEAETMGQWVLIHQRQLVGSYASFDAAADVAVERFGSGPFLIGKWALSHRAARIARLQSTGCLRLVAASTDRRLDAPTLLRKARH